MLRYILVLVHIVVAISSAQAASLNMRPGEYVRERDSGTLTIRRNDQNRLTFEIEAMGGNCHSCSVSGELRGSIGHADSWAADGSDSKCFISFSARRGTVVVTPTTQEECRFYCGARAGFEGSYSIPPSACTSAGRQALRERSLALYRSRHYSQAVSTLQGLIAQCAEYMNWIEIDQVRNDLALSQYRNGEHVQCLATLNSTLAAKFANEEELKAGGSNVYLPPCDFDNYVIVAKATWFNRALCTKAKSRR